MLRGEKWQIEKKLVLKEIIQLHHDILGVEHRER